MSIKPCPHPQEGCPYFNHEPPPQLKGQEHGCYSDVDHLVPKRFKKLGWLVGLYIETPTNKVQTCRWWHEDKTERETTNLIPPTEFMVESVLHAYDSGAIALNNDDLRRTAKYIQGLPDGA